MATITCPACKAITNFHVVFSDQVPITSSFFERGGVRMHVMAALQCGNEECAVLIGGVMRDQRVVEHWPQEIFTKTIKDVPAHIAGAAEEAHLDLAHGAYRSAGAMARAVVEATAKEMGVTSGSLRSKIDELRKRDLLRAAIAEAAHEVRHLGNEMAHGDFVTPVSAEEAAEALALMDEVLDEVFQSPARVKRVREAREAKRA